MAQQPPKIPPPAPVYQPYQQPPALKLDPGAQFTGQYSDTYTDQWGNPVPLETIRDPNNVKPSIPDYIPTWNNSFSVADHIQPALDQIQPDTSGLAAFSNEAKRSGPGAWAGLAQKLNQQEAKTQLDQAQRTSAGSTAQAESNLAMRGGLDSGARERLATAGSNQYASAAQSIGNTEATNATKINMQDEQNRIQELEALPGIQNQYLAPQFQKIQLGEQAFATDVQGQEANVTNLNAYNQNRFSTQAPDVRCRSAGHRHPGLGGRKLGRDGIGQAPEAPGGRPTLPDRDSVLRGDPRAQAHGLLLQEWPRAGPQAQRGRLRLAGLWPVCRNPLRARPDGGSGHGDRRLPGQDHGPHGEILA
jgi:hypothetical protein